MHSSQAPIGSRVTAGIRPEWIQVSVSPENSANAFTATVEGRTFLGDAVIYWVRVNSTRLVIKTTLLDLPSSGAAVIKLPSDRCMMFDEPTATVKNRK
jgi:hypothetical protein